MALKHKKGSYMQQKNGQHVVQLATRIPKPVYRELKLFAVENDESISELVATAILAHLAKRGWKPRKLKLVK